MLFSLNYSKKHRRTDNRHYLLNRLGISSYLLNKFRHMMLFRGSGQLVPGEVGQQHPNPLRGQLKTHNHPISPNISLQDVCLDLQSLNLPTHPLAGFLS